MNIDDGISLIWGVGALVLVGSSLAARRLPIGQVLKMVLIWIAIFAALFVIFSFRPEIKIFWERVKAEISGEADQKTIGDKIFIRRGDDGHFSVRAQVNGKQVDFLIDSGASLTSMNPDAAMAAGVDSDISMFPILINTANGKILAKRAVIQQLQINNFTTDNHNALISDGLGDSNLLGMNFLNDLKGWKVEGDVMTLEPYQR